MSNTPEHAPKRRTLLVGAGVASAAAAAAAFMPKAPAHVPVAALPTAPADEATGYRLTEHIQRYYDTARG